MAVTALHTGSTAASCLGATYPRRKTVLACFCRIFAVGVRKVSGSSHPPIA